MAHPSDIASASIAVQMEASRLESRAAAGDKYDFADLHRLVGKFEDLVSGKSEPEPEPAPEESKA